MTWTLLFPEGPYTDDNNRILRVNMANIRRKLEKIRGAPVHLAEIRVGYRMAEDREAKTIQVVLI